MLGLIAGLEAPTAGRISIGGQEISSLAAEQRARLRRNELGLVFQSDNLLPFLTAVENVGVQLVLDGESDDLERCRGLLGELGLADEAGKLPDQLSGGQRQRVAVARALVHRPRLVLADEPTGALDAGNSGVVIDALLGAQREYGATLVVVTHDPEVAGRLDRVIHLRDGRPDDRCLATSRRDLLRNPRRTLASMVGVALGVGLFSGVLFFIDGSGASMTKRAIAPVTLDMQRVLTAPLGGDLRFSERLEARTALRAGQKTRITLVVTNDRAEPANEVVVNGEPPAQLTYLRGTTTLNGRALRDVGGQSPLAQGLARSGLNIGTVRPGQTVRLAYTARARRPVGSVSSTPAARPDLQSRGRRARAGQRTCAAEPGAATEAGVADLGSRCG